MQGRVPDKMKLAGESFRLAGTIRLPALIFLSDDEVHLWQVDLGRVDLGHADLGHADLARVDPQSATHDYTIDDYATVTKLLSVDERERAARFRFAKDQRRFAVTRAILRKLLSAYLAGDPNVVEQKAIEPRQLVFRYSAKEKPALDEHAGRIEFNVSHSGTVALLAFARGRALGVDVEQIREQADHDAIARRFFSEHEQKQLAALPAAERCAGFFRCWTRKEAYIKATGDGLSLPLHEFDVSLRAGDENALLATRPDAGEAAKWSMREVSAAEGYAAALCVRGHGWKLRC